MPDAIAGWAESGIPVSIGPVAVVLSCGHTDEVSRQMQIASAWHDNKCAISSEAADEQAELKDDVVSHDRGLGSPNYRQVIGDKHEYRGVELRKLFEKRLQRAAAEPEHALIPHGYFSIALKILLNGICD